jgi:hypothetical protein
VATGLVATQHNNRQQNNTLFDITELLYMIFCFTAFTVTHTGPHGDLCEGRPRCANCHGPHWASYSNCAAAPWRTAGRVVRPTKKELTAARRAGHLAYLQESLQANASEGSGDEAAPDRSRPATADAPTEVPTQAPAKRNRTPTTSTSDAGPL